MPPILVALLILVSCVSLNTESYAFVTINILPADSFSSIFIITLLLF
nr:MAG TPA: hypothetical protein [Bacteriophage sp.]